MAWAIAADANDDNDETAQKWKLSTNIFVFFYCLSRYQIRKVWSHCSYRLYRCNVATR